MRSAVIAAAGDIRPSPRLRLELEQVLLVRLEGIRHAHRIDRTRLRAIVAGPAADEDVERRRMPCRPRMDGQMGSGQQDHADHTRSAHIDETDRPTIDSPAASRGDETEPLQLGGVLEQRPAPAASIPFAQQAESAARAMFRPRLDHLALGIHAAQSPSALSDAISRAARRSGRVIDFTAHLRCKSSCLSSRRGGVFADPSQFVRRFWTARRFDGQRRTESPQRAARQKYSITHAQDLPDGR